MKHSTFLSGTALFVLAAGAAQAEVSSSDVWAAWQASAAAAGQTITAGAESMSGSTLTVSDVQVSVETDSVSAVVMMPSVSFTEVGDGTVTVVFPDSYSADITADPNDGPDKVMMSLSVSQTDLSMIASGAPGAVNYDFEVPEMVLSLDEVTVDGEAFEPTATLTMTDVSGTYMAGEDDTMSTAFNAASMDIVLQMDEPDGGDGAFSAEISYADVATKSDGAMSMFSGGVTDLPAMLEAGAATSATLSHGAATFAVDFQDGRDAFTMNGTQATGLLAFALSAESISYELGATAVDMVVTGSEIPLPEVAVTLGEFGFGLLMPMSASEEPQDFGLALTLADLGVSEMIWGMVDPQGQIPHDPATLIVDVTGMGNTLFDLYNPESAMSVDADLPAQLHELSVNEIKLAVAGADLTGDGAFTFDNDNLETFGGVPAPTGKLNLQLVGANALIDALVGMGLVPQDQAMGARMMMGLFARPGEGEDTLVSEIEIDGASGAISANGQRIQ